MCKNCAFTGHRSCKESPDEALLERVIENLIKNGVKNFLCGMAVGFDMLCAEIVIDFKKKYDVNLIACIPCKEQPSGYSSSNKARYERILGMCDEIRYLSEFYYKGCMQVRDRYLVDNCDILICFLRKRSGGTYYTVNYASAKNIKIIEI